MSEDQAKRAAALAQKEWDRVLAATPAEHLHFFKTVDVERVFKECIRHAYFEAVKDALNEARAAIETTSEMRRRREAGEDPKQKN